MYIPRRYPQFSLLWMLLVIISEWSTVDIKRIVAYPHTLTVADSLAHPGDKWPAFICYLFRKLLEHIGISSPALWFSTSHHFLILVKAELRYHVSRPQCCRSSAGSTTRNTNSMHPFTSQSSCLSLIDSFIFVNTKLLRMDCECTYSRVSWILDCALRNCVISSPAIPKHL